MGASREALEIIKNPIRVKDLLPSVGPTRCLAVSPLRSASQRPWVQFWKFVADDPNSCRDSDGMELSVL